MNLKRDEKLNKKSFKKFLTKPNAHDILTKLFGREKQKGLDKKVLGKKFKNLLTNRNEFDKISELL